MQEIADAVDYIVPQFYEAETPRNVREFIPITSLARLKRGLRAAGALGKPFYAGLPSYGHALVYSGTGKLLGGYHDMSVAQAFRHPAMKLLESYPVNSAGHSATAASYIGEDVYRFVPRDMRLEDPDAHDQPDHGLGRKPYYLVYDVPSLPMIAQNLKVLRENRPSNCRGVIIYRFPERGEVMALPLASSASVLRGKVPAPRLSVSLVKEKNVWDVIDTGKPSQNSPNEYIFEVSNVGAAGSAVSEQAVQVTLSLENAKIEAADCGAFDSVGGLLGARPDTAVKCSLKRANILRFSKVFLGAGEKARIGPISLKRGNPDKVEVEWTVAESGGFGKTAGRTEVRLE
jgi:hypothetical protein